MDLRRFITLKTVVEEGSFLRASQKLCCTQSTVTFHIQQLEQDSRYNCLRKLVDECALPAKDKSCCRTSMNLPE